jgi:hypothetical protein
VIAIAVFASQPAIAKANPDDYKVILTLNDGTVINGFLKGDIMGDKIKVSETFKGKGKKYSTTDIKSLVFPPTESDEHELTFVPVMVHDNFELLNKNPKNPRLLMKVYETDRMIGYISPAEDFTFSPNMMSYWNSMKYYYHVKGEKRAYTYWKVFVNSKVIGLRTMLKKCFKRFPSVKDFIDSKAFDSKEFFNSPEILMPVVDEALLSGNYTREEEE